jgi:thiol-disulfide isomerase/thioredoxin
MVRGTTGCRRSSNVIRPPRPPTPPRRALAAAALTAAAGLAAAGCEGGAIGASTVASNGKSFVSGAGTTTTFAPGSRPAAPAVTGTSLTGGKITLASYRGRVLVLNFWGSWCTPCREEAPALAALARHYRSAPVRFLGVDISDNADAAKAFMRTFNLSYPSLSDPGDTIALAFHGSLPPNAIPSTLVIDPRGRVAARVVGGVSYRGLEALVGKVAAGRS